MLDNYNTNFLNPSLAILAGNNNNNNSVSVVYFVLGIVCN